MALVWPAQAGCSGSCLAADVLQGASFVVDEGVTLTIQQPRLIPVPRNWNSKEKQLPKFTQVGVASRAWHAGDGELNVP